MGQDTERLRIFANRDRLAARLIAAMGMALLGPAGFGGPGRGGLIACWMTAWLVAGIALVLVSAYLGHA